MAVGEGVERLVDGRPADRRDSASAGLPSRSWSPPRARSRCRTSAASSEGSALLMTYATAIHALVDRGRLEAGQTLLVLGAAGGVGLAAVEIGKALGARVIAAVSSRGKSRAARGSRRGRRDRLSARPVRQGRAEGAVAAVQGCGRAGGADVIFDPVGGDYTRGGAAQHRLGRPLPGGRLPGRDRRSSRST